MQQMRKAFEATNSLSDFWPESDRRHPDYTPPNRTVPMANPNKKRRKKRTNQSRQNRR